MSALAIFQITVILFLGGLVMYAGIRLSEGDPDVPAHK